MLVCVRYMLMFLWIYSYHTSSNNQIMQWPSLTRHDPWTKWCVLNTPWAYLYFGEMRLLVGGINIDSDHRDAHICHFQFLVLLIFVVFLATWSWCKNCLIQPDFTLKPCNSTQTHFKGWSPRWFQMFCLSSLHWIELVHWNFP